MSSIAGNVNHSVGLNTNGYSNSLTVYSTGKIAPGRGPETGYIGVISNYANAAITNSGGHIYGGAGGYYTSSTPNLFSGGAGVRMSASGTILNNGTIVGGTGGVGYYSGATGGAGVDLRAANITLTNNFLIEGGSGGAGNYYNLSSRDAFAFGNGGAGVDLTSGSSVINSGTIRGGAGASSTSDPGGNGGAGVYLNGGTLTNFGTIAGGAGGTSGPGYPAGKAGDAVLMGFNGGTLIDENTAIFNGLVVGNGQADSVLALDGTSTTPLAGLGTEFTGFGTLAFTDGAARTVVTDTSTAVFDASHHLTVTGFTTADTLEVANLTPLQAISDFNGTSDTLTANGVTIQFAGDAGRGFIFSPDGNGVDIKIAAACYCRGTRILTTRGERPIEALAVGDTVITASGEERPVRWLGHRPIDCRRHPQPADVLPIRIRAGAIADQQPLRDCWVSPGHSLLIDGVLIQAEKLLNGLTILQESCDAVEYWHVELDRHDILVADGLPAESYLDTGNRNAFINGGAFIDAHPDFKPKDCRDTCAPLMLEGPDVERARARCLARAPECLATAQECPAKAQRDASAPLFDHAVAI